MMRRLGKKGQTWMTEETLKFILAVIVIVLLILLVWKIISIFRANTEYEQAKATITGIEETTSHMSRGEGRYYLVESPKTWMFVDLGDGKVCYCSPANALEKNRFKPELCASSGICTPKDKNFTIGTYPPFTTCYAFDLIAFSYKKQDSVVKNFFKAVLNVPAYIKSMIYGEQDVQNCILIDSVPYSIRIESKNQPGDYFSIYPNPAFSTRSETSGSASRTSSQTPSIAPVTSPYSEKDTINVTLDGKFTGFYFVPIYTKTDVAYTSRYIISSSPSGDPILGFVKSGVISFMAVSPEDKTDAMKNLEKYLFISEGSQLMKKT